MSRGSKVKKNKVVFTHDVSSWGNFYKKGEKHELTSQQYKALEKYVKLV